MNLNIENGKTAKVLTLLSDNSRVERADEASRSAIRVNFAKFLPIWSSQKLNDSSDLLDKEPDKEQISYKRKEN